MQSRTLKVPKLKVLLQNHDHHSSTLNFLIAHMYEIQTHLQWVSKCMQYDSGP